MLLFLISTGIVWSKKSRSKADIKKSTKPRTSNLDDYASEDTSEDTNVSISPMSSKAVDFGKKLIFSVGKLTKSIAKNSVDLVVAKHVSHEQIFGKWLLRQEVELRPGIFVTCPATIQFEEDTGPEEDLSNNKLDSRRERQVVPSSKKRGTSSSTKSSTDNSSQRLSTGTVITVFEGVEYRSKYTFTERYGFTIIRVATLFHLNTLLGSGL